MCFGFPPSHRESHKAGSAQDETPLAAVGRIYFPARRAIPTAFACNLRRADNFVCLEHTLGERPGGSRLALSRTLSVMAAAGGDAALPRVSQWDTVGRRRSDKGAAA